MKLHIQPLLENEIVSLSPLQETDFNELYRVASDPEIWEQHPNKLRWQKEIFKNFFEGALESKGAYKIIDKETNTVIGSTRFYDYEPDSKSIHIGYTFYATAFWGRGYNDNVKSMMLDYIFQFVSKVIFHIGSENIRSQIAIARVEALKINEQLITYYGESPINNFIYELDKENWELRKTKTKLE